MRWPWQKKTPEIVPPPPLGSLALQEGAPAPQSRLTPYVPQAGRLMITDHGMHPPEIWAQATAEQLIQLAPDINGERRAAALRLQAAVQDALVPHHRAAMEAERSKLGADIGHMLRELDPSDHVEPMLQAVIAAAQGTPWEERFAREDVQAALRHEIAVHVRSVQLVERSWHHDRNSAHPVAQQWRQIHHPGA